MKTRLTKEQKQHQLNLENKARELGKQANLNGKMCVPAHDAGVIELLKEMQHGKESLAILTAWQQGFIKANLDKPFNFED